MDFKRKSKISSEFSLASMSDMIFLLLIFFLITSTLVSPNGIKVVLPKANNRPVNTPEAVNVSVDVNGEVYLNAKKTTLELLPSQLKGVLTGVENPTVGISADKSVSYDKVMEVIKIATKEKYRILLKTDPE
jgi:biopolymer transport protein ExbD